MKRFFLLLVGLSTISLVKNDPADLIECKQGSHRCADNSKCVLDKDLCDFNKDCDDYSDERFYMCSMYHQKRGACAESGMVYHPSYRCQPISTVCVVGTTYYHENFRELCNELKNGLLPDETFKATQDKLISLSLKVLTLQDEKDLQEMFEHLAVSFNESKVTKNDSICPPLYVNVGGRCVAFFSVATVTWAEAKQFCESISGTLAIVRKMKDYEALLKYLKNEGLTTNFWIGGFFKWQTSSWAWLDEKDIVMGAPFWRLFYSVDCSMRGTSTNCYRYSLAPQKNEDGYCLTMDYTYYHYFSDQSCLAKRSPLCFLNDR